MMNRQDAYGRIWQALETVQAVRTAGLSMAREFTLSVDEKKSIDETISALQEALRQMEKSYNKEKTNG